MFESPILNFVGACLLIFMLYLPIKLIPYFFRETVSAFKGNNYTYFGSKLLNQCHHQANTVEEVSIASYIELLDEDEPILYDMKRQDELADLTQQHMRH